MRGERVEPVLSQLMSEQLSDVPNRTFVAAEEKPLGVGLRSDRHQKLED